MPEKTDKDEFKELFLEASAHLDAAEKKVGKARSLLIHGKLSDMQAKIIELERKDPKHYNKDYFQEKFDMLMADFNAGEVKHVTKEDDKGLYDEFIEHKDKAKSKLTTMYRSYKRIQRNIGHHEEELEKKEE